MERSARKLPVDDATVAARLEAGASQRDLAAEYQVSRRAVRNAVVRHRARVDAHEGGTGATRALDAPEAPESGQPAAQNRQTGGRSIPEDYVGTLVVRGEDAFVFPLEAAGEVLSQWPGVRDCGLEGFRETLALMVLAGDLIFDTDHSPTYPIAVEDGGRRRFVCVRESRTAEDVARLGNIRRYDARKGERRDGYLVHEAEIDITDSQGLRREITKAVAAAYPSDPPRRRRSGVWNPNAALLEQAVRTE